MSSLNRAFVARNPYQTEAKRVLCICSAGLLRSPTAANVLHQEYGYNTRAVGIASDYALITCDEVLAVWADEVVCMTAAHEKEFRAKFKDFIGPVHVLDIPDDFVWNDQELRTLIAQKYAEIMEREKSIRRDVYGRVINDNVSGTLIAKTPDTQLQNTGTEPAKLIIPEVVFVTQD